MFLCYVQNLCPSRFKTPMDSNTNWSISIIDIYPIDRDLPHTPYFYIIEHISTGKKYAGCKFAIAKTIFSDNGCHTIELLKLGGYTTSSKTINDIIETEGIEAFRIIKIVEEPVMNGLTALQYKTKFLQDNDIAGKPEFWYNKHNNTNGKLHDLEYFKTISMERYGFECPQQSPKIKAKTKATCKEKYGVDNAAQDPEVKEKVKATNLERYGVENTSILPEIKEKIRLTNQKNHGVDHNSQTDSFKKILKERMTGSKYYNDGVNNYRVFAGEFPNESWLPGMITNRKPILEETRAMYSKMMTGSKFYNDGIKNYRVLVGNFPDPSWVLGKLKIVLFRQKL